MVEEVKVKGMDLIAVKSVVEALQGLMKMRCSAEQKRIFFT